MRDDIRYALRRLRRQPGFTAVALLSLALGIGVNTAIFTLVNAVMLRDAPAANSEQLVNIYLDQPGFTYSPLSYPEYRDVEAGTRDVFAGISGALLSLVQRDHGDRLETLPAELVTGNHCELLGQNVMSRIWSGAKKRCSKNSSSGWPETISSTRPSVSNPAPGL